MADNLKKRGKPDTKTVNMKEDWERDYWKRKFRVSGQALAGAVRAVGCDCCCCPAARSSAGVSLPMSAFAYLSACSASRRYANPTMRGVNAVRLNCEEPSSSSFLRRIFPAAALS